MIHSFQSVLAGLFPQQGVRAGPLKNAHYRGRTPDLRLDCTGRAAARQRTDRGSSGRAVRKKGLFPGFLPQSPLFQKTGYIVGLIEILWVLFIRVLYDKG